MSLSVIITRVLTFLALFYFSPTLILVTDIIHPFFLWIVQTIQERTLITEVIYYLIGYIIVFFSALIYNEIIIFNFCGLSKNTKKFVLQRENREIKQIKEAFKAESALNIDEDSLNND